ncbi:DgyrCDS14435 [Dimorphilus gyrociliatus]|uniref:DgyrCDS14435 n=1 Tax=Dimorphilus gyrociliatus TaxID=2664684 RepID=A0A7I8WDW8_9ANNE|nr:DgyrCDS14435 [Dimorphilus gyrociliatus]
MAFKCHNCHSTIYGRQKYLKCSLCKNLIHRKCTETHNIPICKPCNKRKCTVMLKKLTNLEIHQFKVNSEESFIDERNKIAAVEESILEDENHVLSECQSMDLDSLEEVEENAEEYCESSTKSDFEIVKGGSRKGHDILLNDGYSFVVKHKTPSSTIWVCSVRSKKKRCVARIRQNGNLFLKGNLEHNHNRKKNLEVDIKVKTDLKIVCRSDNQTSGRSIAEKVLLSYEPNATCLPDINYLKRMANSNRQKFRPVEPKVYNFNLDETFLPDEFLQKDICENGERILIFATNHQLNLLSKSNCWYIDGTFKIVKEPFYQLVTIHSFVKKSGDMKQVPLVFIFLTSKHTKAYLQAFQHINNLINDFHPKRITMDFEKGLWKALSKVYPLTEFQGCVFHFTQAVYRKIQALGYVKKYKEKGNDWKDFRKLMALPFLPAHIIQPTFDSINAELCEKNRFLDLLQYFQTNWIKNKLWKPNNWSVFGLSIRTNNDCEGWHQRMNSKLPAKGCERTWVRSHPPRVRSHPGTFTPRLNAKGYDGSSIPEYSVLVDNVEPYVYINIPDTVLGSGGNNFTFVSSFNCVDGSDSASFELKTLFLQEDPNDSSLSICLFGIIVSNVQQSSTIVMLNCNSHQGTCNASVIDSSKATIDTTSNITIDNNNIPITVTQFNFADSAIKNKLADPWATASKDPYFKQIVFDSLHSMDRPICYDVTGKPNSYLKIVEYSKIGVEIYGQLKDDYYMHRIIIKSLVVLQETPIEIIIARTRHSIEQLHLDVSFKFVPKDYEEMGGLLGHIGKKQFKFYSNVQSNSENSISEIGTIGIDNNLTFARKVERSGKHC